MPFKIGTAPGPGRPKGSSDWRSRVRQALQAHSDELFQAALQKALEGDAGILRMFLDRMLPKARDATVELPELSGTLTEQAQQVLAAVAAGRLTPSEGNALITAMASQVRIKEYDEFEQRLTQLEEQHRDAAKSRRTA
ncbi:MAG: hypothetical protein WA970_03100 [Gammaproteobacteria bacterium]